MYVHVYSICLKKGYMTVMIVNTEMPQPRHDANVYRMVHCVNNVQHDNRLSAHNCRACPRGGSRIF